MPLEGGKMSPAHDFPGPDDSDAQFVIIFLVHWKCSIDSIPGNPHLTTVHDGCSTSNLRAAAK
jgi:hypothetical protein